MDESGQQTVPVKSFDMNPWGLYQMHGNVGEWCKDGPRTYNSSPQVDPRGPEGVDALSVTRGGPLFLLPELMTHRSACRNFWPCVDGCEFIGFRFSLRSISPEGDTERRDFDFDTDGAGCRKSLEIFERQGDEHDEAFSYGQLGRMALRLHDFDAAETWYRKLLAIFERKGDDCGIASSYNQLGIVAQARRDFGAAYAWYRKSLAIDERLGKHRTSHPITVL